MNKLRQLAYMAASVGTTVGFTLSVFVGGASAAASPLILRNDANGKTYTVMAGRTIKLVLNARWRIPYGLKGSTIKPRGDAKSYDPWRAFSTSNSTMVTKQGDYTLKVHKGPVKGTKRLTSIQVYQAKTSGTVVLKAVTDYFRTCGPKVACPDYHVLVRYQVMIHVKPANHTVRTPRDR